MLILGEIVRGVCHTASSLLPFHMPFHLRGFTSSFIWVIRKTQSRQPLLQLRVFFFLTLEHKAEPSDSSLLVVLFVFKVNHRRRQHTLINRSLIVSPSSTCRANCHCRIKVAIIYGAGVKEDFRESQEFHEHLTSVCQPQRNPSMLNTAPVLQRCSIEQGKK